MAIKTKITYFAYFLPEKDISGVVRTWAECETITKGEKGAKFKKFPSHSQAVQFLLECTSGTTSPSKTKKQILDLSGLFFDSGTGRNQGVEVSVVNNKGESQLFLLDNEMFEYPLSEWGSYILPKEEGYTNNYGELLALYFALHIAQQEGVKNIYGDSQLVINFWSLGRMNAEKLPTKTVDLIKKVSLLREVFEQDSGSINYIDGSNNPADMGFHK